MKRLITILGLGLIIAMFNTHTTDAQHVSVNINLDFQPAWGPSGYHYAEFYYLPNLNAYYDVNNGLFIYLNGRNWVSSVYLPKKYRKHDLYLMHKVVLNDIHHPWMHNKYHKQTYAHYRNNRSQIAIYYVNDRHYHRAKQNHWAWVEPRYMPKQSHQNHKHLAHQHQQANLNKNQYRSSANNGRSTSARNQNQTNNARNTQRNEKATTNTNRTESRSSSTARSNENRTSTNRQNENKQTQKTENRGNSRNNQSTTNNTKRTETQSSNTRSSENRSTVEKRSSQNEKKRTEEKTENRSRSSSNRSNNSR